MNDLKILKVPFCGTHLQAIEHNNKLYVAMRPICQNIGLQWSAQYNRIMRDEVLNSCVFIMKTQLNDDTQKRDIVYLPLSMINGWLFGITTKKIKPELKEKLITYKRECYDVLYNHWNNERFEFMKEMNKLMFEFNHEKEGASHAGRILSNWKQIKPKLESKINKIIERSQLRLSA